MEMWIPMSVHLDHWASETFSWLLKLDIVRQNLTVKLPPSAESVIKLLKLPVFTLRQILAYLIIA